MLWNQAAILDPHWCTLSPVYMPKDYNLFFREYTICNHVLVIDVITNKDL